MEKTKDTSYINAIKKISYKMISIKSIKRLARRAGIKRVSKKFFINFNNIILKFIEKTVKDTLMYKYF